MAKTRNYSLFFLRLLALFFDNSLFWLLHFICFYYLAQSSTLAQLTYNLVLYLTTILIPVTLLKPILYDSFLVSRFGATPGKFITGLKVTDTQGKLLSFRRSLFRHTIGYNFSGLIFGLGFLSIITNPNKQTWHDQAVNSQVSQTRSTWPLALLVLFAIFALSTYFTLQTYQSIQRTPLQKEVIDLFQSILQQKKNNQQKNDKLDPQNQQYQKDLGTTQKNP